VYLVSTYFALQTLVGNLSRRKLLNHAVQPQDQSQMKRAVSSPHYLQITSSRHMLKCLAPVCQFCVTMEFLSYGMGSF